MDAAQHRELDELRRRAFGPGPGLGADAGAAARLDALELIVRDEFAHDHGLAAETAELAAGATAATATTATTATATAAAATATATAVPDAVTRMSGPRRARSVPAAIGSVVSVALAAVVAFALTLTAPGALTDPPASPSAPTLPDAGQTPSDATGAQQAPVAPDPELLLRIGTPGAFGLFSDAPTSQVEPEFATTGEVLWSASIGEHYGWTVWVAGATENEFGAYCLALVRGDEVRSRCGGIDARRYGTLNISLVGADVPSDLLATPLTDTQSIRFWWLDESAVRIILGSFDTD